MSMNRRRQRPGRGFTLIELLVVIAIIALLVSILVPSLTSARALAQRAVCCTHMRSIGTGLYLYLQDNQDVMPPRYMQYTEGSAKWYWYFFDYFVPLVDPGARPAKGWSVTVANQPASNLNYNRTITGQLGAQPFGNSHLMNCPGQRITSAQHYAANILYTWWLDNGIMGGPAQPVKISFFPHPQDLCQVYEPQASAGGGNEYMGWNLPVIALMNGFPHLKSGAALFLDGHADILTQQNLTPYLNAVTANQGNPSVSWPFINR